MSSEAQGSSMRDQSWLRRAIGWPAFYFVIVLLGAVELGWLIPALVIHLVVPEPHARRIGRAVISFVFRNYFRLTRVCGVLEVDDADLAALDPREAMIIAPNHPTGLDALILIARLDYLNCIMKASMLDNLFLGAGARLAGYIRNDGPRRMFRLSTEDLRQGGQLIIFPEATRTLAAPVNPFKGGFAAMARAAGVPIQTIIVETNTPYLSKGWSSVKKPPVLPMKFRVRLGKRFEAPAIGDLGPFVATIRAYFVEELAGAPLGRLWDSDRMVLEDAVPAGECCPDDDSDVRRGETPAAVPSLNTSR
jgi:1-acyl-sn-glycerol-3-phosphate acyltransferase